MSFALPLGTTVIVRDVSGNQRDYTLPATANSYPALLPDGYGVNDGSDRAQVMFGHDPFFDHGGFPG
jgi:hypothetical protein